MSEDIVRMIRKLIARERREIEAGRMAALMPPDIRRWERQLEEIEACRAEKEKP